MNPTRSESIKNFLLAKTHSDLANLYNINMEVQVNVGQDGGQLIEGVYEGKQWRAWTDGQTQWKSFRIPINAKTDPHYTDREMKFDLAAHAEGIGMTGWDWQERKSRWVAFDFDAIIGHSDKHAKKLTDIQIGELEQTITDIPWVSLRRSTGGKGRHLYVFLNPLVDTANHTEHAALARAILGKLSAITGFDFFSKVDICGGNMWVWHRKMSTSNRGLELLRSAVPLSEVPANWRDHINVTSGRKRRSNPGFLPETNLDDPEAMFEELTGQRTRIPLDENHRRLITWLEEQRACWWWDQDHHMLITHTYHLKEAHTTLSLKGSFETNAKGTEKGIDHNCFSGHTEILTRNGPVEISFLDGQRVDLYVQTEKGMEWLNCEIRCFGKQKTIPIAFGHNSVIRCTKNHRWITYDNNTKKFRHDRKKYTYELNKGKDLIPYADIVLPKPDEKGYAHGFVYGDGWYKRTREVETTEVALFKHDNDLKKLLCKFGKLGSQKFNNKYENVIRQLPKNWKEIPENYSREYACGFILGLISADGFVNNTLQIFQTGYVTTRIIREIAIYAGFRCGPVRKLNNEGYDTEKEACAFTMSTYNVTKEMFLRKDHKDNLIISKRCKGTTLAYINLDDEVEENVYCAVVPHYQNFTLATGEITSNCFAYPMRYGAWSVRRYTPGVSESPTWEQDPAGWTKCYFNREPDLATAARINEGVEHQSGGYDFRHVEQAAKAAQMLGANIELPPFVLSRKARIKAHKGDNKIVVEFVAEKDDNPIALQGWNNDKNKWHRVIAVKAPIHSEYESNINYDDFVRHLVTSHNDDFGWVIKSEGVWRTEPYLHVKTTLSSDGLSPKECTSVLGGAIVKAWTVVNFPFQPEYPGDRRWNRDAAQLRFALKSESDLQFPTWRKIFEHIGRNLDDAVRKNKWCQDNAIISGADYLICWVASLFKEPMEPLPYLFLYGPQDSGKSIFHEAIERLVTKGVMRADAAITSNSNFNAELEHAILCVIEETDLKRNRTAYNRIKDWVTSPKILIHRKGKTPYTVENCSHWIQCVPKNVWIQTDNGPRQVKDLINKCVNIVYNGKKYSTNGFFPTGEKDIYLIETNKGYYFEATNNHKVLTSNNNWVEVKDLNIGDELQLTNNNINWHGAGNFHEGYTLGWLFGDGSFRKRKSKNTVDPVLYFYKDEDTVDIIKEELTECNICYRKDGAITIAGKQLLKLCEKYNLKNKIINEFIEETASEFYEGFISALFDTDGSVIISRKCVQLYQSNKKFLQTVQRMLLRLGIISSIYKVKNRGRQIGPKGNLINTKDPYILTIRNKDNLIKFHKKIGFNIKRKKDLLDQLCNSWTRKDKKSEYKTEIINIEKIRKEETYDITVPDIHAFDGNGFCLHNCANEHLACPIFPGDARIVMVHVEALKEKIPKKEFLTLLEKEASDFLTFLFAMELPKTNDRLNIPVVITNEKLLAEQANRSLLETFLDDICYYSRGHRLEFKVFYDRFSEWVDPAFLAQWPKQRVARELPPKFPHGRGYGNAVYIGNITIDEEKEPNEFRCVCIENKLEDVK